MEDGFEIPVHYRNQDLMIPGRLLVQGYTYKIETVINEATIYFEPDEERNFRALLPPDGADSAKAPDAALLQTIAEALSEILK